MNEGKQCSRKSGENGLLEYKGNKEAGISYSGGSVLKGIYHRMGILKTLKFI